jgi:hypothetical protein
LAAVAGGLNATRLAPSASATVGAVTVETTIVPAQAAAGLAAAPASTSSAIDFNYSLASAVAFATMTLGAFLAWSRWRQRALHTPPRAQYQHYNPLLKGKKLSALKRSARNDAI